MKKITKFSDTLLDRQIDEMVREVNTLTGLAITIVTAKLTTTGVNGSMTFIGGRLIAQLQAT